jgi:nitronate monooxygenase
MQKKWNSLGAHALIAVNARAGGHAGNLSAEALISLLKENCELPVISAGGVGCGEELQKVMEWGAAGASIGTIFIACEESEISPEYKQAMIDYGEKDIVRTTKLSGSPLTVINTPYVQQLGTKANLLEWILHHSKSLRKYTKVIIAFRGMKAVEKAGFGATYKTVWCAGPSIEHVRQILPMEKILKNLLKEYVETKSKKLSNVTKGIDEGSFFE